ncbi:hypothetical protein L210DRAFT_3502507 [Boletus edulis BED1]|uniref:Uncharacterized protein n=1 Tax=Boletus edulis BED1 TaxID=1328754 RepID=A0AAD4GH82_BOLED|nr:hypothetical protein L210DRAFT_3502507 [Boletus edulis BED1]
MNLEDFGSLYSWRPFKSELQLNPGRFRNHKIFVYGYHLPSITKSLVMLGLKKLNGSSSLGRPTMPSKSYAKHYTHMHTCCTSKTDSYADKVLILMPTTASSPLTQSALLELSSLLGKVGWKGTLRHLENNDICSMMEGADGHSSEGRRWLLWIWLMCGYTEGSAMGREDDSEELQDVLSPELSAIHIKWCKTHARAYCWVEEVKLLVEE